ncbi:Na(+)-translocating NADH-quinone reductase subunit C [Halieaceae bacterium IMCC14734]|uniref:Na(+)-translocating NADH-quinone reductase subunit C n=1 Tax=Candidatus Litorirhabdus singularis TaxID=2518993 RepID=A0ABT3THF0_9GAMM|nr:Na(+)-translocating NADH-quinone reductase subunit C [Candidatus Litorirhabdus singularis]MCX2981424.1 Na(+)-translocating NADH-quinone reductase subunit C [Candidatus Litorirhabdus singularis]
MANNDSIQKTLIVAVSLCVVCSVLVSGAAVALKDMQVANKLDDRNRNILAAAGLLEEGTPIAEQFSRIETRLVDLDTGEFVEGMDPESFDQRKSAKNPSTSLVLSSEQDVAKVRRRSNYALVYLVREQGELEKVVLPLHGYGLWSTMYGFVALQSDLNTVAGLGFYEHGETPGLGGEIDNPRWKASWPGKKIYQDQAVALELIKGSVDKTRAGSEYQVDGLAGATLTSRGVTNMVHFWMGQQGFGPFLEKLKAGDA